MKNTMFIVTDKKIDSSKRICGYCVKTDNEAKILMKGDCFLVFEGYLYPDIDRSIDDLFDFFREKRNLENLKNFKGKFSGVFFNSSAKEVFFFNDQLGLRDLFYYKSGDRLIISNSFREILKIEKFKIKDVDKFAINQFLIFDYPLFDRTFIKDVKLLPLASIFSMQKGSVNIKKFNYWKYELKERENFNVDKAVEDIDFLLNRSTQRIIDTFGRDKIYGLGLSGGYDSRLEAQYLKDNGVQLKTFIFGEPNSDAYFISNKIANLLGLEHYELGVDKNFIKYAKESVNYNPMINVLFVWYYSIFKELPNFDVLVTGFNGDNQFGSHLITNENVSNEKLIEMFIGKYGNPRIELKERERLNVFLNKVDLSTTNKWENFNYNFRQVRFIKENPSFNFLGAYKGVSLFEDIDVVEYLLNVPYEWKKDLCFFKLFFEKKLKSLYKIREERGFYFKNNYIKEIEKCIKFIDAKLFKTNLFYKKSHKDFKSWLQGNQEFYKFASELARGSYILKEDFNEIDFKKELDNIYNGEKANTLLFFRGLTVKLFVKNYLY